MNNVTTYSNIKSIYDNLCKLPKEKNILFVDMSLNNYIDKSPNYEASSLALFNGVQRHYIDLDHGTVSSNKLHITLFHWLLNHGNVLIKQFKFNAELKRNIITISNHVRNTPPEELNEELWLSHILPFWLVIKERPSFDFPNSEEFIRMLTGAIVRYIVGQNVFYNKPFPWDCK